MCSLTWRRNSHSPLLKLLTVRRAQISTPNTWLSTSSGAITTARKPGARQPLREREWHLRDVGLVHQVAAHAARQPVLVDRARSTSWPMPSCCASGSLRAPTQVTVRRFSLRVVQADAAEVDRQFVLEARDHHLEDAAQVLALADGVRDARQQRQTLQLLGEPRFVRQRSVMSR